MPATHTEWTAEMVRALPDDGKRYEVVDGELLVTPSPRFSHQHAVGRLFVHIAAYCDHTRAGLAMISPADIELSPRRLVQPDVFVTPCVNGKLPSGWKDVRNLMLVAEVLSHSTARADRQVKRRLYQSERVPEYWIVDVDARLVERWHPDDTRPQMVGDQLEWLPAGATEPFLLDLPAYFREVTGE